MCQQPGDGVLERAVEAGAVYHGIIRQIVINMLLHASRVPYVSNGNHADAVCSLYGHRFLHDVQKRAVSLVKTLEKQIPVHGL